MQQNLAPDNTPLSDSDLLYMNCACAGTQSAAGYSLRQQAPEYFVHVQVHRLQLDLVSDNRILLHVCMIMKTD